MAHTIWKVCQSVTIVRQSYNGYALTDNPPMLSTACSNACMPHGLYFRRFHINMVSDSNKQQETDLKDGPATPPRQMIEARKQSILN